jgi:hypothetical protein
MVKKHNEMACSDLYLHLVLHMVQKGMKRIFFMKTLFLGNNTWSPLKVEGGVLEDSAASIFMFQE